MGGVLTRPPRSDAWMVFSSPSFTATMLCRPNPAWSAWKGDDFGICHTLNLHRCQWPCELVDASGKATIHAGFPHARDAYPEQKDVTAVVARCQESLNWLDCTWGVRFVVYEKCLHHPGFRRPKVGSDTDLFFGLVKNDRNVIAQPSLPCVTYVTSHPNGREAEAYLHHIVNAYRTMDEHTWFLFLQGSAFDEIHVPLLNNSLPRALRAMSPRVWFASLSGVNMRVIPPNDQFSVQNSGSLRIAGVFPRLHSPFHPVRAQFIARGDALRALPLRTWRQLLFHTRLPRRMNDAASNIDENQYVAIEMEHAWSSLLGCYALDGPYALGLVYGKGFECADAAPSSAGVGEVLQGFRWWVRRVMHVFVSDPYA